MSLTNMIQKMREIQTKMYKSLMYGSEKLYRNTLKVLFNLLSPKNDQYKDSPCDINAL